MACFKHNATIDSFIYLIIIVVSSDRRLSTHFFKRQVNNVSKSHDLLTDLMIIITLGSEAGRNISNIFRTNCIHGDTAYIIQRIRNDLILDVSCFSFEETSDLVRQEVSRGEMWTLSL